MSESIGNAQASLDVIGGQGYRKGKSCQQPTAGQSQQPRAQRRGQAGEKLSTGNDCRKSHGQKDDRDHKTEKICSSTMAHLFSHLPQFKKRSTLRGRVLLSQPELHPAVIALGVHYANGSIRGANARTAAMLLAFQEVIAFYEPAPDKVLNLDLDKVLKPHIQYLIDCRSHSIAMGNAVRWLRGKVHAVKADTKLYEAKDHLQQAIHSYIAERITVAAEAIARSAVEKLPQGDVVLVYGRSHSVELTLKLAHEVGLDCRVIIVDSRPLREGRHLLKRLTAVGIHATYCDLNAISYILPTVNKVLLGAAAMLSNGTVISRTGTALVAMMAKQFNIPAIFLCETYKFSEKVQLDSICWNEVGDPFELRSFGGGEDGKERAGPHVLNIRYDLTPMKYVSLVITECGLIPPTSVPVLIREYNKDDMGALLDVNS